MLDLGSDELERLIQDTLRHSDFSSHAVNEEALHATVVGSLFHNVAAQESRILDLTCARLGHHHVELGWDIVSSRAADDILSEVSMLSPAVDLLVTGFIDRETLGAGRSMVEEFPKASLVPVVNLVDEMYSPQSALAVVASFWERLGELRSKRIVISWGFGSVFTLPSTAHSLLMMCTSLGADVKLISPPGFSTLKRVIRGAEQRADGSGSSMEESAELQGSLQNAHAVFALNWCSLDDFNHPERTKERALQFDDWYFTQELLPKDCFFMSEPPLQTDLLVDTRVKESVRNLTPSWYVKRVQALAASMSYVRQKASERRSSALI